MSLFSPKHRSADDPANDRNLASADDRASADDLEIHYHLASADNLESRHKQTAEQTRNNNNSKRLCPREAVKFNVKDHGAAVIDFPLRPTATATPVHRFVRRSLYVRGPLYGHEIIAKTPDVSCSGIRIRCPEVPK